VSSSGGVSLKQHYEIRVQGRLGSSWSDWFEGLTIHCEVNGETVLHGPVDQAILHGVLMKIRDLGLPLVSVCRTKAGDRGSKSQSAPGCEGAQMPQERSTVQGADWEREWLSALEKSGVQFLVLDRHSDSELLERLRSRPGWAVDYEDGEAVIFVPRKERAN